MRKLSALALLLGGVLLALMEILLAQVGAKALAEKTLWPT